MKKILSFSIIILMLFGKNLRADEGMWIPLLLNKYNIEDMQSKGFKLTAADIYSVNQASMKDAVMLFGGGCTAELISNQGLLITNHHCGFGAIQKHSSLEHDYLTDGFWATADRKTELANPGLTVSFLVRMEDVTTLVLEGITDETPEDERQKLISERIEKLEKEAIEGTSYKAKIKPFYYGEEFYMFVSEEFKDIRLVGAPPSAIGKFGGDTDNWMWPRHTGDFSIFRIYADKNNNPAEYSEDNVPYTPKKSFKISMKGVQEGDFTMVFGYPGRTQQFLPAAAVEMLTMTQNPARIKIRQMKIDHMSADMEKDPKVRIQYASKYARVSNYWKKWIGENRGLNELNAMDKKKKLEAEFTSWASESAERQEKYGNLLPQYNSLYKDLTPYALADDYFYEAIYSQEIVRLVGSLNSYFRLTKKSSDEEMNTTLEKTKKAIESFFKDYNQPTDLKIFTDGFKMYLKDLGPEFHPSVKKTEIEKKYSGNIQAYIDFLYANTVFTSKEKLTALTSQYSKKNQKTLQKDPFVELYNSFISIYLQKIQPNVKKYETKIGSLHRMYVKGLREMQTNKVFYPDANSTLRVAYGKVEGSFPVDGIKYTHFTTLEGIIAKDNPEIYDYRVPEKLKELYRTKDYGQYAENGKIHVCFLASNHTTGGNSGSPVINGEGHLIGVNFDRSWESTMSDIMYDPDQCRNITLDIRYALFIIDKFAGAGHLVEEMDLVF